MLEIRGNRTVGMSYTPVRRVRGQRRSRVDMHAHNVLRKRDVRSRLEAARRADELGLLT